MSSAEGKSNLPCFPTIGAEIECETVDSEILCCNDIGDPVRFRVRVRVTHDEMSEYESAINIIHRTREILVICANKRPQRRTKAEKKCEKQHNERPKKDRANECK